MCGVSRWCLDTIKRKEVLLAPSLSISTSYQKLFWPQEVTASTDNWSSICLSVRPSMCLSVSRNIQREIWCIGLPLHKLMHGIMLPMNAPFYIHTYAHSDDPRQTFWLHRSHVMPYHIFWSDLICNTAEQGSEASASKLLLSRILFFEISYMQAIY